jgi:IstB-like ATP binding protein
VASALAQKVCRDGYSVYYTRTAALFRDLNLARADGSLRQLLKRLNRIDVVVIDDWAMAPMSEAERRDFWEIAEDRYQARSMILTSQLPVSRWHEQIGSHPGRRHPRSAGAQRSSHRDARRIDAQAARGERRKVNTRSTSQKLWKRRAKNALGNRFAIPTFRTASTTTSLTIVITFWKIHPPASLRSDD